MLGGVVHANQPGQYQDHASPFLLDAVGPLPIRVGIHALFDGCARARQQDIVAHLVVEPEVTGPYIFGAPTFFGMTSCFELSLKVPTVGIVILFAVS